MRRSLKFLHTLCAVGYAGGLAAYMTILMAAPESPSLETYAALREALAFVATWLIMPSMLFVIVTGLLAMAIHFPFHDEPWVWIKALTGILIFEASLGSIDAPAQDAVVATTRAMAGELDAAELARLVRNEWGAWWTLLGLSVANVALAIWRPRFRLRNKEVA